MKILFVAAEIESQARGINYILKHMVIAAKQAGHQTGLLVGYPHAGNVGGAKENEFFCNYMKNGKDSFSDIVPGGYSKASIVKSALNFSLLNAKQIDVDKKLAAKKLDWEENLDFYIKSPFIYQFFVRNINQIPRMQIKKITKKFDIDLVIVATPSILRKQDLSGSKLAHFVHDFMPLELEETPKENNDEERFLTQITSTINNSDFLLANSDDTAKKIININKDASVNVLYGSASSSNVDTSKSNAHKRFNLKKQGYLLFASTLEKRKNVERLLEAYSNSHKKIDMPLVLIGAPGYGFEDIYEKYRSLPSYVQKDIYLTGYISEEDKYCLFENGYAFVFPSIYEGIGLIIIEAMQSKLPVISSSRGALPEAGGDAAIYIDDPYSTKEIEEKILHLVNNPGERDDLINKGLVQVKKFTPEKFHERFDKAIKENCHEK